MTQTLHESHNKFYYLQSIKAYILDCRKSIIIFNILPENDLEFLLLLGEHHYSNQILVRKCPNKTHHRIVFFFSG